MLQEPNALFVVGKQYLTYPQLLREAQNHSATIFHAYVLDPATGHLKWTARIVAPYPVRLTIATVTSDGGDLVADVGDKIEAFDASHASSPLWTANAPKFHSGGSLEASLEMSIEGGEMIFPCAVARLCALSIADGRLIWNVPIPNGDKFWTAADTPSRIYVSAVSLHAGTGEISGSRHNVRKTGYHALGGGHVQ